MIDADKKKYPVGRFQPSGKKLNADERAVLIDQIAATPGLMREAVWRLHPSQLDVPYREGGWTARQVVHHVPDSHLNSYIRFKLALTEESPTIRPYDEAAWAKLPDTEQTDIETSLLLLESLHKRWVTLLRAMTEEQWSRRLRHPEIGEIDLHYMLELYAWHGRHHLGHVRSVK